MVRVGPQRPRRVRVGPQAYVMFGKVSLDFLFSTLIIKINYDVALILFGLVKSTHFHRKISNFLINTL